LAATSEPYIQDDWWASCEAEDGWQEPDPLDQYRRARDRQILLEVRARAYDQLRSAHAFRLADGCRLQARTEMDRALTAMLPALAEMRQQCLADPFLARMIAA
jgi:hypothetical protein